MRTNKPNSFCCVFAFQEEAVLTICCSRKKKTKKKLSNKINQLIPSKDQGDPTSKTSVICCQRQATCFPLHEQWNLYTKSCSSMSCHS